jgi:ankyrin repeat protein
MDGTDTRRYLPEAPIPNELRGTIPLASRRVLLALLDRLEREWAPGLPSLHVAELSIALLSSKTVIDDTELFDRMYAILSSVLVRACPLGHEPRCPASASCEPAGALPAVNLVSCGFGIQLWEAAALGDVEAMAQLLERDRSLATAPLRNGAMPLHLAGTVSCAAFLVDNAAQVEACDRHGTTAARAAAYSRRSRRDVARFLMALSGECDAWLLAALDDAEGLRELEARGHDVAGSYRAGFNPAGEPGETPLHTAAALGSRRAVEFLLACGSNPNAASRWGARPLHYAARFGSATVANVLLSAGADAALEDRVHHATAAVWARYWGHLDLAESLNARIRHSP